MRKKTVLFIAYLFLFVTACSKTSRLEQALNLAEENRGELDKVLAHYSSDKKDSLKYKAACFLIENMPYRFSYKDEAYSKTQTALKHAVVEYNHDIPTYLFYISLDKQKTNTICKKKHFYSVQSCY